MRLRVLLFAGLRDAAGTEQVELELPEDATAGTARAELERRFPALSGKQAALALDLQYVTPATPLRGARELALIPPVSGG